MLQHRLDQKNYHYIILGLAMLAAYWPVFQHYWIHDDFHWLITAHRVLHDPGEIFQPMFGFFRPLTALTFTVFYGIFHLNPVPMHCFSLFMHFLTAVMLYRFVSRITSCPSVPLLASLIFTINMAHNIAVISLSCITEIYAGLFSLLFLLHSWNVCVSQNTKHEYLGYIYFFAALISKSINVLLPVIVIFMVLLACSRMKSTKTVFTVRIVRYVSITVLIILVYGAFVYAYPSYNQISLQQYGFRLLRFLQYMVFPDIVKQVLDLPCFIDKYGGPLIVCALFLFLLYTCRNNPGRQGVVLFAGVWMLAYLTLISLYRVEGIHIWYLYIPDLGFSIILAEILVTLHVWIKSPWLKKYVLVLFIMIVMVYCAGNWADMAGYGRDTKDMARDIEHFMALYPDFENGSELYFLGMESSIRVPGDFFQVMYNAWVQGTVVQEKKYKVQLAGSIFFPDFYYEHRGKWKPELQYLFYRKGGRWFEVSNNFFGRLSDEKTREFRKGDFPVQLLGYEILQIRNPDINTVIIVSRWIKQINFKRDLDIYVEVLNSENTVLKKSSHAPLDGWWPVRRWDTGVVFTDYLEIEDLARLPLENLQLKIGLEEHGNAIPGTTSSLVLVDER